MKTFGKSMMVISVITWTAAAAAHTVTLSWQASSAPSVTYNVWRSKTEGSGYAKINSSAVTGLTYKDRNVWNGSTYYYVVTAFDGKNNSTYSNEISVSCYCHIKNGVKVCSCSVNASPGGMAAVVK